MRKDLEIVTLSKWVRRRKINIWHHLYLESLSKNGASEPIYKTEVESWM